MSRWACLLTLVTVAALIPQTAFGDNPKIVNCAAAGSDLQKAIDTAASGSVIQLAGSCNKGPYFVFKDLTLVGTGAGTTLSASSGDRVLHVGGARVGIQHLKVDATGRSYGVIIEERGSGAFDDVEVDGSSYAGILIQLTSYASIVNTRVTHNIIGIDIEGTSSAWIVDSKVINNAPYGIQARQNSSVQVIFTEIASGSAGLVIDEMSSAGVVGSMIHQNTGPGVWVPHTSSVRFSPGPPLNTIENNGPDVQCGRGATLLFDAPQASATKTTSFDAGCFVENTPFAP
jgi:hypothetical protein